MFVFIIDLRETDKKMGVNFDVCVFVLNAKCLQYYNLVLHYENWKTMQDHDFDDN